MRMALRPRLPTGHQRAAWGALHDLHQPPPLVLGQRPGFHDAPPVPRLGFVALVMHLEGAGRAHHAFVPRVAYLPVHAHDDGLLHLVADDLADPDLALAARLGRSSGWHGGLRHPPPCRPRRPESLTSARPRGGTNAP